MTPKYSFVIPVYNEEDHPGAVSTVGEVMEQLDGSVELILVNDGGRDRSTTTAQPTSKTRVFAISALLAISVIKSL